MDKKEERRLEKRYGKYLKRHSGQAYKCMSFEEWKMSLLK